MDEIKSNENQIKSEIIEKNSEKIIEKRGRGRPKKDESASSSVVPVKDNNDYNIKAKIDKYLNGTEKINWTIAGMARAVGLKSARQFIDFAQKREGAYSYGLLRMEEKGEEFLFTKMYPGAIFLLKQLGWEDTQHVETEVKAVTVNVSLAASLDDLAQILKPLEEQVAQ